MNKAGSLLRRLRQSVFLKVGALFLAALVLASVCLLAFSQLYFRRTTRELSGRIRAQTEMSLQLTVNDKLDDYARVMYQTVIDVNLRKHLQDLNAGTAFSTPLSIQRMEQTLSGYIGHSQDLMALSVFSNDANIASQDATRWNVTSTLWGPDLQSGRLREIIDRADTERRVFILPDDRHPEGASFFHVVLGIWDYYSREPMGTLVATVNAAGLWRVIGSMAAEEYAFDFLMHADGRLLVHPDYTQVGGRVPGYRLDTGAVRLVPSGEPAADLPAWQIPHEAELQVKKLPRFEVYLVSVLDNAMYQDLANYYTGLGAVFVVAIAAAVAVLFSLMLRRQTGDIHAVIEGIRQMRDGRLDVRIKTTTKDEIYDIAQTFNASLQSLEIITQQRDEEMQRFLWESERRRKAEVRSLQSQINSHFLYNTLNVINYAAMEGDTATTSSMLQSLAGCLHYTLNQNLDIVAVRDEISWLEKYLLLQKERQPTLFNYRIETEGEVLGLPVHKLILQPFVENAILHGFSDGERGHTLVVRFVRLEAPLRLSLTVSDDGVGMNAEKLAEIRDLLNNYEKADGLGIGIENSCFRISTHYKNRAEISVHSQPGQGTQFHILLPLEEDMKTKENE